MKSSIAGVVAGLALATSVTGAQAVAVSSITITGGDFGNGHPAPADCAGGAFSSYQCISGNVTFNAGDGQSEATAATTMFHYFNLPVSVWLAPSAAGSANARDWTSGFQGTVTGDTIELNMGGFYARWADVTFLQGTDSAGTGGSSTSATGTVSGNTFDVRWQSHVVGEPFDNSLWFWHLTGTYTAAPVPEASTYAMLLIGLGMMGLVPRRRRKF